MSFFKDTKDDQQPASSNAVNNFFKNIRDRVADVVTGDKAPVEKSKKAVADKPKEKASKDKDGAVSPERKPKKSTADKSDKSPVKKEGRSKDSIADEEAKTSEGSSSTNTGKKSGDDKVKSFKISQFESLLDNENVDLGELRKLSWNGVPAQFRWMVWQLLLGYMPTNKGRRDATMARKRKEYLDSVPTYYNVSEADRTTQEGEILRQILVDIPRTSPDTPFFQQPPIQSAMERILYIWSIRHPASAYVQGMNDLLTPLLLIAMYPHCNDVLRCDVHQIDAKVLSDVEADAYWCLTKLLDDIQDHYTFSQPGLQRMMVRLEDLIARVDEGLHSHFREEGLQFLQFGFRWMNCLLLRELPLAAIMRVWDTYLAEETSGFESFHVYVCAVLLERFRDKLLTMQFQEILMFLQELPTSEWGEEDVEPLLAQAYIFSTQYSE